MRNIPYSQVVDAVRDLCLNAAMELPSDVCSALEASCQKEQSVLGRALLNECLLNAETARQSHVPLCQDTGTAVFFISRGNRVCIEGGLLSDAVQEGTRRGYCQGFLRKSMVRDPLFGRENTSDNTPAIIHVEEVAGEKLSIILAPKGAGSENMSALRMMKPSDGPEDITDFVVETVWKAGGNPCPPVVVGVGIGGTFDSAPYLAKKALLRTIGSQHPDPDYRNLEQRILSKINDLGIGPQGLGGLCTALAVHIETYPCHIASLPVAINLNCHAARHARVEL